MLAAEGGFVEAVELMLNKGADFSEMQDSAEVAPILRRVMAPSITARLLS